MPVRIVIPSGTVEAKVKGAWDKGLALLSNEVLNDCNEYCKYENGALRGSSMINSILEEGKLIWQTPYARRQYWEIKTALTPGTTWKWCETAKRKCSKRWQAQAQRIMEMNL